MIATLKTIKRTPAELRRDDRILWKGHQARINMVVRITPGIVQVLALTDDGRLIEPTIEGLVDCVVED